ncbi:hypothetical protein MACH18_36530 [Phaeobacter italicus]|uniref:hypothetical protein n=1 Tax=Phaeobacter italicus TaxID=481446 RepID=UPI00275A6DDD|nr:hypothetical protein [Phaeobacter italicus]GLO76573.1 hypothetical protein MACH18_36530 [Phaeobacter italicus]
MLLIQVILALVVFLLLFRVYSNHSWKNHKSALFKALFLWIFSSLPIIITVLYTNPKGDGKEIWQQFLSDVGRLFTLDEMFVYAASFLSPVIYVAIDLLLKIRSEQLDASLDDIKKHLRGMEWVIIGSLLLLFVTATTFSSSKVEGAEFEGSYLYLALGGKAVFLYGLSLLMWYTTILHDTFNPTDVVKKRSEESANLADKFKARLDSREQAK